MVINENILGNLIGRILSAGVDETGVNGLGMDDFYDYIFDHYETTYKEPLKLDKSIHFLCMLYSPGIYPLLIDYDGNGRPFRMFTGKDTPELYIGEFKKMFNVTFDANRQIYIMTEKDGTCSNMSYIKALDKIIEIQPKQELRKK